MPPAGVPSVSTPWTAGPAGRDDVVGARRLRILWCIAALVVLAALALLVIDLQNLSRASAAARRGSGGFLWALAGLLPALAGAEASRTWTICRTTTGPCMSATLTSGLLGPIATTPAGPTQTHDSDLLIVGQDWATLFRATGVFQVTGTPHYLRMPVMFGLLYGLGAADDGRAQVTVHSVVRVEQQAIERLNRPSS